MCDDGSVVLNFLKIFTTCFICFHHPCVHPFKKQIFNCESPSRRWLFQISVELWLHLMLTSECRENFIFFYGRLKNILLPVVVLFSVRSDITLTVIIVFSLRKKGRVVVGWWGNKLWFHPSPYFNKVRQRASTTEGDCINTSLSLSPLAVSPV